MSIKLYAFLEEDLHLDETLIMFIFYHNRSRSNIYIVKRVLFLFGSAIILCSCQPQNISDCFLSEFIWIIPFSWLT